MTIRERVKQAIESYDHDDIITWVVANHRSYSFQWVEVYPNGDINEAVETSIHTKHYINYPTKEVAKLYHIASDCDQFCNCDVCTMFNNHEVMTEEEFVKEWSQEDYDFCEDTSRGEAIIDHWRDHGGCEDDIIDEMLEALNAIPYGYFDDED